VWRLQGGSAGRFGLGLGFVQLLLQRGGFGFCGLGFGLGLGLGVRFGGALSSPLKAPAMALPARVPTTAPVAVAITDCP